ncbi:MAG: hypothetical protein ACQEW9_11120 [Bacteroidota bacterium]|uniref:Uncharacterized protein n=1 Tax=Algoriphagus faecimaris TaxID=686796 RepID=A0A1G6RQ20_9BACT|nr:hypothetical protein [Algoriphagus faecimaris]SDD06057.1 hypothetical protein SAMN04488104_101377 [Algoriphagus faecimaris]
MLLTTKINQPYLIQEAGNKALVLFQKKIHLGEEMDFVDFS